MIIGILQRAGDAREKTVIAQEEENAKLTFTEVQMELTQGKSVDNDKFQQMIDGNFGSNKATGTIGGNTYIITVARTGTNYQMDSNGSIGTLAELPIDFAPGILEQNGNTYTINSIEDLVAFSYNVNSGAELYEGKTVELGRNLDFKEDNSYVDATTKYKQEDNGYILDTTATNTIKGLMTNTNGTGFIPIGKDFNNTNATFKGTFDGKEHSIKNLYEDAEDIGGFFGCVSSNAQVSNLSIITCDINGNSPTGGLVGVNNSNLVISNCHVSGEISSNQQAGGIIGQTHTDGITLVSCSNGANIVGNAPSAGIVGQSDSSTTLIKITNCYNTGAVICKNNAGGILGVGAAKIINCYNTGHINNSESSFEVTTGGIIGLSFNPVSVIINCYNDGNVSSNANCGGIAGSNVKEITNCYNNKSVNGGIKSGGYYTGGIIGNGSSSTIKNCYNFSSVTSNTNLAGGISGFGGTISNCYNKGAIETKASVPVGGIGSASASITNSHNIGTIIGNNSNFVGEIIGYGTVDENCTFLEKESNANQNGATPVNDMTNTMSIDNFITLINSYVSTNNSSSDSTKTILKTWKVENGMPVFTE